MRFYQKQVFRKYMADGLTIVVISTVLGFLLEYLITGINAKQTVFVRVAHIVLNFPAGLALGKYKDYLAPRLIKPSRPFWDLKKVHQFALVTATIFVHVPFYVGMLKLFSDNHSRIFWACLGSVIIAYFISHPLCLAMNKARSWFGVLPEQPRVIHERVIAQSLST